MIPANAVKFCSLRDSSHAEMVVSAGADLFGLIFAPARRQVPVGMAREIVAEVRRLGGARAPLAVGVFVDASADEINRVAAETGIDLAQLHGSEPADLIAELEIPAIKTIRPESGADPSAVAASLERYWAAPKKPVVFLVEGFHPSAAGGAGVRADWSLVSGLAERWPVILAGGLTPENVEAAIESARPRGVDVSGGVETDGAKDRAKIAAFATAARRGFSARR
jgi:phosphoribosylanthranilate isomerase